MNLTKQKQLSHILLLAPLSIIFLEAFCNSLLMPDLVRMLSQSHHLLSESVSQIARNYLLGLSMAIPGFIGIVLTPLLGKLSDRWGRKPLLILTLALTFVGLLLPILGLWLHSFFLVFLSNFFAFMNCIRVIAKTTVADIAKGTRRKLYFGWTTLALNLGGILGPLLGSFLSNSHNGLWFTLQTPYYFGLGLVVINFLILVIFFQEPKHQYNPKNIHPSANVFRLWLAIRNEKPLILPLAAFLFFEYAFALYINDIPLFWHSFLHVTVSTMSEYTAFTSSIVVVSLLLIYPLWLKWIPKKHQLTSSILLLSVSYVLLSIFSMPISRWLLTIPVAVFAAISYPQLLALLTSCVSDEKYGWVMGVMYSIVNLVWATSAIIMVPLNQFSAHLPLFVTGSLGLIAYGLLKFWQRNLPLTDFFSRR